MNPFPSILVPLDGSATAAASLGCATWLAERLDSRLHILSATPRTLPARDELVRLRVVEQTWPRIALHQAAQHPEQAILAAVAQHDVRLVIMTARGQTIESAAESSDPLAPVGHVARAVIERCPVPVLLLPRAYRERLPWERVLVPVSGEPATDDALALAVELANALELEAIAAHVTDGPSDEGLAAASRYADAVHHEYPARLDALVRRALPQRAAPHCRCITQVALCRGDVAAELLKLIETEQISLLAIGWHGRFMAGHARVLKHLLEAVTCPTLLVKPKPHAPFTLKVGEEFE
jgi:nucleotide-binding universal stress UspA family protein